MPVTTAFFTTEDSFAARFDALGRQLGLRAESADELRIWQRGLSRATSADARPGHDGCSAARPGHHRARGLCRLHTRRV